MKNLKIEFLNCMIKLLKYFTQSIFVYPFFLVGRLIGLSLSRKFFSYIFIKIASNFRSSKIIEKNLDNFPIKMSRFERDKIIKNMWKNYGMTFVEYIYLDFFRKNNSHIQIMGEKNLSIAIKRNKPVIFVSGHFANYELMSMEITKKDIKLATIYRPLNNYFINPLMEFLRKRYVCKNQIKKGVKGVREAIEYLNKQYSIALMIDQRVSEGEKINFFNKPAFTTTLPAQLALKYDLSIIPVYIERINDNYFKIEFLDEIKAADYKNKIVLSEKLNNVLEKMILRNPNQWIWTHNRWK